jgi:hypothetical protein
LDQTQGTGAVFSETEENVKTIEKDENFEKTSESKKDKEIKIKKMLSKAT